MAAIEQKPINSNVKYGVLKSGGNIEMNQYDEVPDANPQTKLVEIEKRAFNKILGEMFGAANNSAVV